MFLKFKMDNYSPSGSCGEGGLRLGSAGVGLTPGSRAGFEPLSVEDSLEAVCG